MEPYVKESQLGRYLRRVHLGLRFLAHGARAQTTCQWSGLTPDQLVTVRRRSGFSSEERLRGPSPSSFRIFFRSNQARSQSALFVALCRVTGAARDGVSIELGERICEAYEVYREWLPESDLKFEEAMLLIRGAVSATSIELLECHSCTRPILVDKLGDARDTCPRCRRNPAAPSADSQRRYGRLP